MMFAASGLPPPSSFFSSSSSGFSLWSSSAYGCPVPPPVPPPPPPGMAGIAMGGCFPLEPSGCKKSPASFAIADLLLLRASAAAAAAASSSPGAGEAPEGPEPWPQPQAPVPAFQAPLRPRPRAAAPPTEPQGPPSPLPPFSSSSSSKDLKFGIDRILSAEFDPKLRENSSSTLLRDLTSLLSAGRPPGLPLPSPSSSSSSSGVGPFFASLEGPLSEASGVLGPLSAPPRNAPLQHHFQDTFPGPYAVLTKDTLPQTYKRKRSWSRAVFSNLQRKGLEKRFEIQKYVTKPDRKQLAAMLGLTDAQVKVWFQNRRMKWRHSKEAQAQKDKDKETPEKTAATVPDPSPEGESESSESDSLELEPDEAAEGTEANAEQALRIHSRESLHPGPETPSHPEPPLGALPGPDPNRCHEPPLGLRDSP